jgi:alkylated DNA nucleotide flippase Atl1
MSPNNVTYAAIARRVQAALDELAAAAGDFAASLEIETGLQADRSDAVQVPKARGSRQQEILDLLMKAENEEGMRPGAIAKALRIENPNTYTALEALAAQGLAERIPNSDPQEWRLAERYRRSQRIVALANVVRPGEWTSYGDISQVMYGHPSGGQAVGMVMLHLADQVPGHRILAHTGEISEYWSNSDGQDRTHAAQLLRGEGVEVSDDFFAHGRHRVTAAALASRLPR